MPLGRVVFDRSYTGRPFSSTVCDLGSCYGLRPLSTCRARAERHLCSIISPNGCVHPGSEIFRSKDSAALGAPVYFMSIVSDTQLNLTI